ncbi:MAG TPA: hypothetical protein VGW12_11130 [Pyrinomonadaceae bacterium]|nr:hypothetical protein [Pyrinomonadaceae bacterium]
MRNGNERQSGAFWARLILFASALNVAGILCLNAATRAPEPIATTGAQGFGYAGWSRGWAALLDSLGFTLMMPGIFFASSVFVCAHVLTWSERATRNVWYATGFGINLLTVWRAGVAWRAARETE